MAKYMWCIEMINVATPIIPRFALEITLPQGFSSLLFEKIQCRE
jgi:hypothetical protein